MTTSTVKPIAVLSKTVYSFNTRKALNGLVKAEDSIKKAQGGLSTAILQDCRNSKENLKLCVAELRLVLKASDLSDSTQKQYAKSIGKIGSTFKSGVDIPDGDLKAIYDNLLNAEKTGVTVDNTTIVKRKPRHSEDNQDVAPIKVIGDKVTLANLRSLPNILSRQGTYSMRASELYQAFLVQIDLDFKFKATK